VGDRHKLCAPRQKAVVGGAIFFRRALLFPFLIIPVYDADQVVLHNREHIEVVLAEKRSSRVSAEVRFEHFEPTGMSEPADVVDAFIDNDPGIAGSIVAGNGFEGDRIGHKLPPEKGASGFDSFQKNADLFQDATGEIL
jgi:hypothetical protein